MKRQEIKREKKTILLPMAASFGESHVSKSQEVEDPLLYASELTLSSVLPMVLQSTIDLGVLDIMSKAGPEAKLSPVEIAAQLPTTNPEAPVMVDRMLRLLAGHKIIGCSQACDDQWNRRRLYYLTAVSKYFVNDKSSISLAPLMSLQHDSVYLKSWSHLKDAVLDGGVPFERAHGMPIYEYTSQNPKFNKLFNLAMFNFTTVVLNSILDQYKGLSHVGRLVDVGGGLGVTLKIITDRYPSINGINFDLPHVIQRASPYPGIEHIGGDMFKSVPKGDAIILKLILHNWSDDYCVKLLKNCYTAIPEHGKVIVMECILPYVPENEGVVEMDSKLDLIMLAQNTGGKVRAEEDFISLATKAGFRGIRKECCANSLWVIEFFK